MASLITSLRNFCEFSEELSREKKIELFFHLNYSLRFQHLFFAFNLSLDDENIIKEID